VSPTKVYSGCPSKVAWTEPSDRLMVPNVPVTPAAVAGPVIGGQFCAHVPLQLDLVGVSGANEYSVKPSALVRTVAPPIVAVFRLPAVAAAGLLLSLAEDVADELHAARTAAAAATASSASSIRRPFRAFRPGERPDHCFLLLLDPSGPPRRRACQAGFLAITLGLPSLRPNPQRLLVLGLRLASPAGRPDSRQIADDATAGTTSARDRSHPAQRAGDRRVIVAGLPTEAPRQAASAVIGACSVEARGMARPGRRLRAGSGMLPDRLTERAQAALLHGQIAFATFRGRDAETLLLKAAGLFEPLDARPARETYVDAIP